MARLSLLIGLGFILTGLLGLFLGGEAPLILLFAPIGGLLMAIAGLICMANYRFRMPMLQIALAVSGFLWVLAVAALPFALAATKPNMVFIISLFDTFILAVLYWAFGYSAFQEVRRRVQFDKMAAANRTQKKELGESSPSSR
jgi:hypothetical protein